MPPEVITSTPVEERGSATWEVGPDQPCLDPGAVHVWSFDLDDAARSDPRRFAVLSPDERGRAARFGAQVNRDRFVAGRATIRRILARYVGSPARDLVLRYTDHGKPGLVLGADQPPLHFNLSHARHSAILAVSAAPDVGADVERVEGFPELMDIASSYFAEDELEELHAMPPSERVAGFFRCWTRKEAVIKAIGHGLSYPLKSFAVSVRGEPRVRWTDGGVGGGEDWFMAHLEPAEEFVGAIAVRAPDPAFTVSQYVLHRRSVRHAGRPARAR